MHAPERAQHAQRIARELVAPLALLAAYRATHADPRVSDVIHVARAIAARLQLGPAGYS